MSRNVPLDSPFFRTLIVPLRSTTNRNPFAPFGPWA